MLFLLNNRTLRVFNEGLVHDFDVFINVADDAWHHYSVVRGQSSSSLSLYIDGALIEKKTAIPMTALQVAGNGLLLGQDQDTIGGGFQSFQALNGRLDSLRLWDKARSAEEIAADFDQALLGTEANLRAYYRFNEASGSVLDSTANAFHQSGGELLPVPQRVVGGFVLMGGPAAGDWALDDLRAGDPGHTSEFALHFSPVGNGVPLGTAETSQRFDLTELSTGKLTFNYFLDSDGRQALGDVARVELGNTDATVLASSQPDEGLVDLVDGAGGWQSVEIDLREFLDESFLNLRFVYESTTFAPDGAFDGWHVDDITISGTPNLTADDVLALPAEKGINFQNDLASLPIDILNGRSDVTVQFRFRSDAPTDQSIISGARSDAAKMSSWSFYVRAGGFLPGVTTSAPCPVSICTTVSGTSTPSSVRHPSGLLASMSTASCRTPSHWRRPRQWSLLRMDCCWARTRMR